jgi:uncharacterized protein (DUF305 family)
MMRRCVFALLAAGVLLLAGCSVGAPTAPPEAARAGGFNDTDVMFAQMMVPHHQEGITIVRLAKERASGAEVRMLAAAIESTQSDEMATMSEWLRDWGRPPTAAANAHAEHGGMPRTTEAEIAALAQTTGAAFDRLFLNLMIGHQDDAIQVARMETATGANPRARDLADQIDRSRSAQIENMLEFLGHT